jgi:hypothetical protein
MGELRRGRAAWPPACRPASAANRSGRGGGMTGDQSEREDGELKMALIFYFVGSWSKRQPMGWLSFTVSTADLA